MRIRTIREWRIGRAVPLILAAALFVRVGISSGHGHHGGAEYPQACAVCHVGHLPDRQAPPALAPSPPPTIERTPEAEIAKRPPILRHLESKLSRAPPA
ncbi:MAG: hypothetical protein ACE5JR_11310 [Gemmatimonadota bacterium]